MLTNADSACLLCCCCYKVTYQFTLGSAGLVANLSLFSPWSSKSRTTLSTPHTANLLLLGAQARAVILAAPPYAIIINYYKLHVMPGTNLGAH